MDRGVSAKDLITISRLAWTVYERCRDSSEEFQRISYDVKVLHANINEGQILLEEYQWELSPKRRENLLTILTTCTESLDELDAHVSKYERLATPSQRVFDRLRYGLQDVAGIKDQIKATSTQLAALNISLSRASNRFVFKRCGKYLKEVRGGLHEGSVASTASAESFEEDEFWEGLLRELESAGLTRSAIVEKRDVIKAYFREMWLRGELEEQPPEDLTSSDRPGIAPSLISGTTMLSGTTARLDERFTEEPEQNAPSAFSAPLEFHNPFAHLDEAPTASLSDTVRTPSISSSASGKRRKSRLGSALFKLFGSDAALIEAASDNEPKKVAELLRKGANVNVKDKWGWAPISMAAYGGYPDIAKLLIEAGADLNYKDVDGDTPLDLAESKGHTDVVLIIQEEMTRRAIDEG